MEREHKREPGAGSCGGLCPILKALHYPPVRIIHTTSQHIDTSYRVITSTNVACTHDPMLGLLQCCAANAVQRMLCSECCAANAAVLCTACCDAMH